MAVDLTSTSPSARFMLVANSLFIAPIETTLAFDPTWAFDSSTKITICAAENGNFQTDCIIQNLKVSFKIPVQFVTMPFSNVPKLLGDYTMDEGIGASMANSQTSPGSLGSLTLCKIF